MFKMIILFLSLPLTFAAPPSWVKELSPKISQDSVQVICHGEGPSPVTAYKSALDECRGVASQSILQSFEVKTLTVQTERDNALHEEVKSNQKVMGLQCQVKNSYEEGNERWLHCLFDTRMTQVTSEGYPVEESPTLTDDTNYIILAVVPGCDSILVKGKTPRIVQCDRNPISLVTHPGDIEIIIRMKDYQPKHIPASQWQSSRVLSVFLDR